MSIFPGLLHQIFPAAAHKRILFQQIPELAEATGLAMRIPMAMDWMLGTRKICLVRPHKIGEFGDL